MSDSPSTDDPELQAVAAAILELDPDGKRTAKVLRETIDQLYDGQRTGRYRWDQLYKTEKTHCGTLVEINLQREFKLADGNKLDYLIADLEVDCKFSQRKGGWMIPPEARDQICLVVWAEDSPNPLWSMGLVRAKWEYLNLGENRDAKATLSKEGTKSIKWLWNDAPLHPNVLLQLDDEVVRKLMNMSSGQARVCELFRVAEGMIVGRSVVATVAQQDDYMKRVRANGGARTKLRPEGIVILGHYHSHADLAEALNLPRPTHGDSISVRLTPAYGPGAGVAFIAGSYWRRASPDDPLVEAPELPAAQG